MVKWRGREGSKNVIDSRGAGAAGGSGIALLLIRFILSRFGLAGVALLAVGFVGLTVVGVNPLGLLSGEGGPERPLTAEEEQSGEFVSVVLRETEIVWGGIFTEAGSSYSAPQLRMFSNSVQSACGGASSASGPFYCPADRIVYLDTAFFSELSRQFGAPGDFAAAYVVAHEVGHHVQALTGVADKVRAAQGRASQTDANALQVNMELQADCYAGVWANRADETRGLLDNGDIEEGLRAASAIGDDTLQRNAGRRVTPESFTHGTSEQRVKWFRRGYRSGAVNSCDTFNAASL